jgi:hypothetical protein
MILGFYTIINRGGIGVDLLNSAYSQAVNIYTIATDIGLRTRSGSFVTLNGSDCSIGNFGLVSEGIGPLQTSGNTVGYSTGGNFVATSSGIAEIRLRGGGYGTNYNTSLRSLVGAIGILQFGNNADNYILAGNTAAGGYLDIRVNCSTESISAGSLALRIQSNTAAIFYSSVTATSFFESSDKTIKTLIEDNYQTKGIESVVAKLYTKNGKEELGYFAQDVQGILPSAVSVGTDGLLSLSYREVHTAKIARLEKRVAELEEQLKLN